MSLLFQSYDTNLKLGLFQNLKNPAITSIAMHLGISAGAKREQCSQRKVQNMTSINQMNVTANSQAPSASNNAINANILKHQIDTPTRACEQEEFQPIAPNQTPSSAPQSQRQTPQSTQQATSISGSTIPPYQQQPQRSQRVASQSTQQCAQTSEAAANSHQPSPQAQATKPQQAPQSQLVGVPLKPHEEALDMKIRRSEWTDKHYKAFADFFNKADSLKTVKDWIGQQRAEIIKSICSDCVMMDIPIDLKKMRAWFLEGANERFIAFP